MPAILTHPVTLSIFAGICFAAWPQFMNMSRLTGFVSALAFGLGATLMVVPFAMRTIMISNAPFANVVWFMVAMAALSGGMGLVSFNSMLAKVSLADLGTYFGIMAIVQLSVAALVQCVASGRVDGIKITGFVAAGVAGYLLTR
ncbi:MAG: hypothetical protein Q7S49_01045 [bacterium]|nr:hypothetical protein [bacterium]